MIRGALVLSEREGGCVMGGMMVGGCVRRRGVCHGIRKVALIAAWLTSQSFTRQLFFQI